MKKNSEIESYNNNAENILCNNDSFKLKHSKQYPEVSIASNVAATVI